MDSVEREFFAGAPCLRCIPFLGNSLEWCTLESESHTRCRRCTANHRICVRAEHTDQIDRLIYLRGAIFYLGKLGRVNHELVSELQLLIAELCRPNTEAKRKQARHAALSGAEKRRRLNGSVATVTREEKSAEPIMPENDVLSPEDEQRQAVTGVKKRRLVDGSAAVAKKKKKKEKSAERIAPEDDVSSSEDAQREEATGVKKRRLADGSASTTGKEKKSAERIAPEDDISSSEDEQMESVNKNGSERESGSESESDGDIKIKKSAEIRSKSGSGRESDSQIEIDTPETDMPAEIESYGSENDSDRDANNDAPNNIQHSDDEAFFSAGEAEEQELHEEEQEASGEEEEEGEDEDEDEEAHEEEEQIEPTPPKIGHQQDFILSSASQSENQSEASDSDSDSNSDSHSRPRSAIPLLRRSISKLRRVRELTGGEFGTIVTAYDSDDGSGSRSEYAGLQSDDESE